MEVCYLLQERHLIITYSFPLTLLGVFLSLSYDGRKYDCTQRASRLPYCTNQRPHGCAYTAKMKMLHRPSVNLIQLSIAWRSYLVFLFCGGKHTQTLPKTSWPWTIHRESWFKVTWWGSFMWDLWGFTGKIFCRGEISVYFPYQCGAV